MSKFPDKTLIAHHLLNLLGKDGREVKVIPGEEILRFQSLEIRVIVVGTKKHYMCAHFPIPERAIWDLNDRSATSLHSVIDQKIISCLQKRKIPDGLLDLVKSLDGE